MKGKLFKIMTAAALTFVMLGVSSPEDELDDGLFNGFVQTVSADETVAPAALPLTGNGIETSPYLITSSDDWGVFAAAVNGGTDCRATYFKLDNDITVTEMVGVNDHITGTDAKPFAGIFDGDGHVLTVNINSPETHCAAPFSSVRHANIKNLIVEGSVIGGIHSAGLVGIPENSDGNTFEVTNVIVNVDVTDSSSNNGYVGGIVGHARRTGVTLKNCSFGGKLTATSFAGGLVGWGEQYNELYVTNCSFMGTFCTPTPNVCRTVAVGEDGSYVTLTNLYSNNNGIPRVYGYTFRGSNTIPTEVSITAPTAKTDLCYNGSAQELVTAGSTNQGTIEYSLNDRNNYSKSIPTAVNRGDYTVWYRVTVGSDIITEKHISVSVKGTIENTYTQLSASNGEEYGYCVDVGDNSVYLVYKLTATEEELADYDYIAVMNNDDEIIVPDTHSGDGADGKFKTVYTAISFGDDDKMTADKDQYLIGFKIPNMTDVPKNFKIKAVKTA